MEETKINGVEGIEGMEPKQEEQPAPAEETKPEETSAPSPTTLETLAAKLQQVTEELTKQRDEALKAKEDAERALLRIIDNREVNGVRAAKTPLDELNAKIRW